MRHNSSVYTLDIYLRLGMIIVFNHATVEYVRITKSDPILLGRAMQRTAIEALAIGFFQPGVAKFPFEAAGANSDRNLWRTSAHMLIDSDGNEARIGMLSQYDGQKREDTFTDFIAALSSHWTVEVPRSDVIVYPEGTDDPLFIAPWRDAELLGASVLRAFRFANPPLDGGVSSLFDSPEPKGRTALHRITQEGDVDALPQPGRSRRNPDPVDRLGMTPLMLAARHGHARAAERLLELGASSSARDEEERSPLHHAAEGGSADIVRLLLDAGADAGTADAYRRTPLHVAAEHGGAAAVELLLGAGAPPDARDAISHSAPLHLAAREGRAEAVALLAAAGANVNARDDEGRTPLLSGASFGHAATVRALLAAGADPGLRTNNGETPLHRCAFFQRLECMELLLDAGADTGAEDAWGNTPLHVAAEMNRDGAARLLLDAGADVEAANEDGLTPLDAAIVNSHCVPLLEGVPLEEHNAEAAWALLERGASIVPERLPVGDRHFLWPRLTPAEMLQRNGELDYGKALTGAPLEAYQALYRWQRRMRLTGERGRLASLLFGRRGGFYPKTGRFTTLLHDAVRKGMSGLIDALLESGASPDTSVNGAGSPLHKAAWYGRLDIARALVERGADLERPLDIEARFKRGGRLTTGMETPLDAAVKGGRVDVAQFLLERGAQPFPPGALEDAQAWRRRIGGAIGAAVELIDYCPPERYEEMAAMFREFGLPTEYRWDLYATDYHGVRRFL